VKRAHVRRQEERRAPPFSRPSEAR
jgi:hypothetical protein